MPLLVLEPLPLVFRRKPGLVVGDLRSPAGIVVGLLHTKLSLLLLLAGPSRRCLSVLLLMVRKLGKSGQERRPMLLLDAIAIPLVFTGPLNLLPHLSLWSTAWERSTMRWRTVRFVSSLGCGLGLYHT